MKLLIADDEGLTRKGLIASIDLKSLHIDTVLEAENGEQGLNIAKIHKPEIILSDVRMPKMDGITMVEKIRQFNPECSVIFMSGYSDKEYLKAAIKLKAVSYVEKPLSTIEIEKAIIESVMQHIQLQKIIYNESQKTLEESCALALILTQPNSDLSEIPEYISSSSYFTTFIVRLTKPLSELTNFNLEETHHNIKLYIKDIHMHEIHIVKHDMHIIYHIFNNKQPSPENLIRIAKKIQLIFKKAEHFFIAIGSTVSSISQVYNSYSSAVILLQSSFFYDYNSILTPYPDKEVIHKTLPDFTVDFSDAISTREIENVENVLSNIYTSFKSKQNLLPNQVKDIYYKLFMVIQNAYIHYQLTEPDNIDNANSSTMGYLERSNTLIELHHALKLKTDELFEAFDAYVPENAIIFLIKDFISKNYQNADLSVKDISEHVHLSTSYLCTFFKNESNMTLNQYLTEYRIDKAKHLLEDPCNKISDVSSQVGYSDGNYFGKSFKKAVGLSPSEYREKMSQ